jgi:integrase
MAAGLCSEVLTLTRRQVDLDTGTLRLEPGSTKIGEGRIVYLTAELSASIAEELARVKAIERQTGWITPWLFPHLRGNYWPASEELCHHVAASLSASRL